MFNHAIGEKLGFPLTFAPSRHTGMGKDILACSFAIVILFNMQIMLLYV
jgi:hypothetical protein